jgi:AAA domain
MSNQTIPQSGASKLGIQSVPLEANFNVAARVHQLQTWANEMQGKQAYYQALMSKLDMNDQLGLQVADQLETAWQRTNMLRLKYPLEVSAQTLQEPGDYERLRKHMAMQFAALTKEERKLWLNNLLFISTPDVRRLNRKIDNLISDRGFGQARNLLLGGDSGMGKSTYINYLVFQNEPIIESQRNHVRTMSFQAPVAEFGAKSIIQRMIANCGGQYNERDSEERLLKLLRIYIRQCGVELIIIDECEHISRPKLRRRLLEISNFSPHVPIIAASCNPHVWVAGDVEMQERWNDPIRFERYKGTRLAQLLTFVELLLPFTTDSHLEQRQLHVASQATRRKQEGHGPPSKGPLLLIEEMTQGILKDIMALIITTSLRAIEANHPCLTVELLIRTWQDMRSKSTGNVLETPTTRGR